MQQQVKYQFPMSLVAGLALAGALLGALPLLGLIFFSPGLKSEGTWGFLAFGFGVLAEALLIMASMKTKALWLAVLIQTLLLAGVLVETFSDSIFYLGS